MSGSFLEAAQFLAAPFVMCLVLAGIHCYLGLHVLARGVVFVDLSLAQVAAFGATVAVLAGLDHQSPGTYLISLFCTLLAAGLFALARANEKKISQEALIGVVYALSSALVVLVVDRVAHGAEHIKDILVGQVLWVTWMDVLKTSVIYAGVSAVHWIFRKPLIRASFGGHSDPKAQLMWDFLFYALFGVVITSSVSVAGVLQVFAYLIVPSVLSTLFHTSLRARLFFGWSMGLLVSLIGLSLSHIWDLPAGAFLVVCFTIWPVLAVLLMPLRRHRAR